MVSDFRSCRAVAFFGAVSLAALVAPGAVEFGGPFTDGAVLQRDRPVRVWGKAEPGERVMVTFGGKSSIAMADTKGAWRCELPAFAASKESRELVAKATSGEVRVKDVLVGEVWIAAGQSNMEFPLWSGFVRLRERQGALMAQMNATSYVRQMKGSFYKFSPVERFDRKYIWEKFTVKTLSGYGVPAVGACFALELYHALGVPIGIVNGYWGGTMIEPWIPAEGFKAVPALADLAATRPKSKMITTDRAYPEGRANQQPTVLWNETFASAVPYGVRGMIWYQGESNCRNAWRYKDLLKALHIGFATRFENPGFKLYIVQIAPYGYYNGGRMNYVQEAEQAYADEEKNAEVAIINDVGQVDEIHPQEKGTVGKRLAALALANDYGFTQVKPRAPRFARAEVSGGGMTLWFDDTYGEFYTYDEPVGFELAGADGKFVPATVKGFKGNRGGVFKGGKLTLVAPGVVAPRHVRYLWQKPWAGHLFNASTIPLGTFRYDVPGSEKDLVPDVSYVYFVETQGGNDKAAGTTLFTALATPQEALRRIRAARKAGTLDPSKTVTIRFGGGTWHVTEPIVLGPEDSHLRFEGDSRPGNTTIRGGRELGPFCVEKPGLWACDASADSAFEQLWVNGRRCSRAQSPNAGEWFHDRKAGRILYAPLPDETPDGVTVYAPVIETLVAIRGDRAHGKPVTDVSFEHILFEYTAYRSPAKGRDDAPAAVNEVAAIRVTDAARIRLVDCETAHTGAHALWLKGGVRDSLVTLCRFQDMGGGGVYVGECTCADGPTGGDRTVVVTVDNCVIRGGGREMTGAAGVFLGGTASDCAITHNYITDLDYVGVSVGWSRGNAPTTAKRNRIEWNRIHDIGHGVTDDPVGIRTLGPNEGTEVIGNVIHDVVGCDKSVRDRGLRTDEGSSGIVLASNLVSRLKTEAVQRNDGGGWDHAKAGLYNRSGYWGSDQWKKIEYAKPDENR